MRIEPLGDAAAILRDVPGEPWALAEWLRSERLPGIRDVAASYETVGVYFAPEATSLSKIAEAAEGWRPGSAAASRRHRLPVCYEMGLDISDVTKMFGLRLEELASLHTSAEYRCFAVGFCPGFGYLGWLPERLSGLPRLASPRMRVDAGSIGITGRQTAAYPLSTPGGWNLIGRTPLVLVDVEDDYFPITAGDLVTFERIDEGEFRRLEGERL